MKNAHEKTSILFLKGCFHGPRVPFATGEGYSKPMIFVHDIKIPSLVQGATVIGYSNAQCALRLRRDHENCGGDESRLARD
jgi:hypothetical protein